MVIQPFDESCARELGTLLGNLLSDIFLKQSKKEESIGSEFCVNVIFSENIDSSISYHIFRIFTSFSFIQKFTEALSAFANVERKLLWLSTCTQTILSYLTRKLNFISFQRALVLIWVLEDHRSLATFDLKISRWWICTVHVTFNLTSKLSYTGLCIFCFLCPN